MRIEEHLKQYGCFCYIAMKTGDYTRAIFDYELSQLKKTHTVRSSKYVCANGSGVKIQHVVPPTKKQLKDYKALIDKKVTHRTHDELANVTMVEFGWLHQRVIT